MIRQKAETEIRNAVREIGGMCDHPIDAVRARTNLVRKVFDKTLLDMERVGTIRMESRPADQMAGTDLTDLIVRGETVYLRFTFIDGSMETTASDEPGKRVTLGIRLTGFDYGEWQTFQRHCRETEKMPPGEKIREMILEYNRKRR